MGLAGDFAFDQPRFHAVEGVVVSQVANVVEHGRAGDVVDPA